MNCFFFFVVFKGRKQTHKTCPMKQKKNQLCWTIKINKKKNYQKKIPLWFIFVTNLDQKLISRSCYLNWYTERCFKISLNEFWAFVLYIPLYIYNTNAIINLYKNMCLYCVWHELQSYLFQLLYYFVYKINWFLLIFVGQGDI